jgi:serine/threonine-protein kinase RsbW
MITTRGHVLSIEVPPQYTALAEVRRQLRTWLEAAGATPSTIDDLLLVATELCTNAVEATHHGEEVCLQAATDGEAVQLEVTNAAADGVPVEVVPALESGSLQERGRGLAIVRALVDSLTMSSTEGRTVVRTMRML